MQQFLSLKDHVYNYISDKINEGLLKPEEKINILEITAGMKKDPFPEVFGNADLFNFTLQNVVNLDYSLIGRADLLVLNGLPQIERS